MMNPVEVFRILRSNRGYIPMEEQFKMAIAVAICGTAYGLIVSFILADVLSVFSVWSIRMFLTLLIGALLIGFIMAYLLSLRLIKKYDLKLQSERTEIQDRELMETFLGRLTLFEIENRALTITLAILALVFAVCMSIGYGLITSDQATSSGLALNASIVLILVGAGGLAMVGVVILWAGLSCRRAA
jgi:MFS family permease